MKKQAIVAVALFGAAMAHGSIIFQDDFQTGTLGAWITIADSSNVADPAGTPGNLVGKLAHAASTATRLANTSYFAANTYYQLDIGFKVRTSATDANLLFKASTGNPSTGASDISNFNLTDNSTDYTSSENTWYDIRVVINNTASSMSYNQGGGIAGSAAANTYDIWSGGNLLGDDIGVKEAANYNAAIRGFGFIVNNNQTSAGDFYVDNVVVQTIIPEPASLGLIAAAGAGILFIRRRFMI
jgi:hypothetical protein